MTAVPTVTVSLVDQNWASDLIGKIRTLETRVKFDPKGPPLERLMLDYLDRLDRHMIAPQKALRPGAWEMVDWWVRFRRRDLQAALASGRVRA
jgi:hypothetical protein